MERVDCAEKITIEIRKRCEDCEGQKKLELITYFINIFILGRLFWPKIQNWHIGKLIALPPPSKNTRNGELSDMEETNKKSAKETKEEDAEAGEIWGWSWGAGTDGQLGTGSFKDEYLPQPLRFSTPLSISRLACGGAHSIALSRNESLSFHSLFLVSSYLLLFSCTYFCSPPNDRVDGSIGSCIAKFFFLIILYRHQNLPVGTSSCWHFSKCLSCKIDLS